MIHFPLHPTIAQEQDAQLNKQSKCVLVIPVEVNTQVLVSREEALVQIVQLVVVLRQQLQARLVPAGRAHRLMTNQRKK